MKKLRIIFLGLCVLSAVQSVEASEPSLFTYLYNQLPSWIKNNRALDALMGVEIKDTGIYKAGFIPGANPDEDKKMKTILINFLIDLTKKPMIWAYYRVNLGNFQDDYRNNLHQNLNLKSLNSYLYSLDGVEKEKFLTLMKDFADNPSYSFNDLLIEIKKSNAYKFCTDTSFASVQARAKARIARGWFVLIADNNGGNKLIKKEGQALDLIARMSIIQRVIAAAPIFKNYGNAIRNKLEKTIIDSKLSTEFMLNCTEKEMENAIFEFFPIDRYIINSLSIYNRI